MRQGTAVTKFIVWTTGVAAFVVLLLVYSSALSDAKPRDREIIRLSFFSSCDPDFTLPEGEVLKPSEEKVFKVKEGGNLILSSCFGDVEVKTWEKEEVKIIWTSKKDPSELDGVEVRVEQTDQTIRISGSLHDHLQMLWNGLHARFMIMVPVRYNPEISVSGGDVYLERLTGNVKVETSGGDIEVMDISGRVVLETSGGDVSAKGITGDVTAETSGGDVRIEKATGDVHAETSGGDIVVALLSETANVYCATSGGDIVLHVPEAVKTDLTASTTGGDVSLKVTNFKGKIERDEVRGIINGGGSKTVLETSGGDIRILPL